MRVLHAPTNPAGVAGLLARGQRELGVDATSVEYVSHGYGFAVDRSLSRRGDSVARTRLRAARFAVAALAHFDVFHLYFGHSLLPHPHLDLPLLRALGKRVVLHYCGCEVRNRAVTRARYAVSGCTDCESLTCLWLRAARPAPGDLVFVSTPDLLEFVPGAKLVPGPVDLARWTPRAPRRRPVSAADPVKILHAPSDRGIKGTRYVVDAVEALKSAGLPVELVLLERVPVDEILRVSAEVDLVVDQLMIGSYGTVAIEMMARGLPVVCRIRDDLRGYYLKDLPLVHADPHSLRDVLESLVRSPETWPDLGRRGADYVRREHDMRVVAARVLEAYAAPSQASAAARG